MAKRLSDGNIKATWVPAIANLAAPSASTELAGGITLESFITSKGLDITISEGTITEGALSETQDFESPGRSKANVELTIFRDTSGASDIGWTTLLRLATGFLVVRRGVVVATAYAAGQKVEVYGVTCGERRPTAPEAETYDKFQVKMYPSARYSIESTVAA